jgi:hypothetical protein
MGSTRINNGGIAIQTGKLLHPSGLEGRAPQLSLGTETMRRLQQSHQVGINKLKGGKD